VAVVDLAAAVSGAGAVGGREPVWACAGGGRVGVVNGSQQRSAATAFGSTRAVVEPDGDRGGERSSSRAQSLVKSAEAMIAHYKLLIE
jgi:hypothetical protein